MKNVKHMRIEETDQYRAKYFAHFLSTMNGLGLYLL